jgi:hypothetical protein
MDVTFFWLVTVVMKSRETVDLQLPMKRIHPAAAKIDQEIAIDAEPRTGDSGGVRPSRLSQASAQIVHCGLRKGRGKRLHHSGNRTSI